MAELIIEPHYLGSLEYFTQLINSERVFLEVHQHFSKQTFKNRCYLLSTRGAMPLTVPVKFTNRTPFKEVQIAHDQSWKRAHWGAFYSAYGKAPFFEFLADHFKDIWDRKHRFLLDLNFEMMTLCLKILQIDIPIEITESYQKKINTPLIDLREHIVPKKPFEERHLYIPSPYTQIFGNKFVPNLSIIDLLVSEGSNALEVLKKSSYPTGEQI